MKKRTEFENTEYLKFVAGGAETAEDVADILESIADTLRAMSKEDGIEIDLTNISEGHMIYRTKDRELAKKYGFYELDEDGEPIGTEELHYHEGAHGTPIVTVVTVINPVT